MCDEVENGDDKVTGRAGAGDGAVEGVPVAVEGELLILQHIREVLVAGRLHFLAHLNYTHV